MPELGAVLILVLVVGIWVLPPFIAAAVASQKGRSGVGWFALGLLFSWFAVLFAAVVSETTAHRMMEEEHIRRMRRGN